MVRAEAYCKSGGISAKSRLDNMIDEKKLHPLNCLKGLRVEDRLRLADFGFVFIKQLLDEDEIALRERRG